MKTPDRIVDELMKQSIKEGQSLEDWSNYIHDVQQRINDLVHAVDEDVKRLIQKP